jgi:hypothetical protein
MPKYIPPDHVFVYPGGAHWYIEFCVTCGTSGALMYTNIP